MEELDNLKKRFTVDIEHVKKLVKDKQNTETNKTQIINEDSITLSMSGKSVICANGIELINREQNELGFDILVILIENHMKNFFREDQYYVSGEEIRKTLTKLYGRLVTSKTIMNNTYRLKRLVGRVFGLRVEFLESKRWHGYRLNKVVKMGIL